MMLTQPRYTNNYDGTYTVEVTSSCCKKVFTTKIKDSELYQINRGARIQEAVPGMSPADRELFFMTGMCGECWDKLFKFDEDED